MSGADKKIESILKDALDLIAADLAAMRPVDGNEESPLGPREADRVARYVQVLLPLSKDRREQGKRSEAEVQAMSDEELLDALKKAVRDG